MSNYIKILQYQKFRDSYLIQQMGQILFLQVFTNIDKVQILYYYYKSIKTILHLKHSKICLIYIFKL